VIKSKWVQLLLYMLVLYNRAESVTFQKQHIYKNRADFQKVMVDLVNIGWVREIATPTKNHLVKKEYVYTLTGVTKVNLCLKDLANLP
jgi:hypothetical protein